MGIKSRTFDVSYEAAQSNKSYRVQLTEQEKKKVEQMIRNAKSLQEIARLEKELNEGRIPGLGLGEVEMG
jgi:U2 small nuclear ribonucleoprotein A'